MKDSGSGRRRLFVAALVLALAVPAVAAAETRVGGTIDGETRWAKAGSPYIAYEDIVVTESGHLIIEPGVTVRFKAKVNDQSGKNQFSLELLVRGRLTATGAQGDTVVFTTDSRNPTRDDWQGIVFEGGSSHVSLKAAHIGYAMIGVSGNDGRFDLQDVTVTECSSAGVHVSRSQGTIRNLLATIIGNPGGTGFGVRAEYDSKVDILNSFIVGTQNGIQYAVGASGRVENTVITLNTRPGVRVHNASPTFTGCTITQNEQGLVLSAGATPVLNGNNIFDNVGPEILVQQYTKALVQIDASDNWWGTPVLASVEEEILDGLDDPLVKALVLIEPVRTEAVTPETPAKP